MENGISAVGIGCSQSAHRQFSFREEATADALRFG